MSDHLDGIRDGSAHPGSSVAPPAETFHDATSKIAVVDSHALFAESLQAALEAEGYDARWVELDRPGGSTARLLASVLRLRPRLALLDLDLGAYGNGLELIGPLVESGVAVLVVTAEDERARWGQAIASGAQGVVSKRDSLAEVLLALRRLSTGRAMMPAAERAELVQRWRRRQAVEGEIRTRLAHLTQREAEVLGALMDGKPVGEIARERFVSESTVRTQVKSVLAKLNVNSQLTAVGLAHRAHWSPDPTAAEHA